MGVNEMDAVEMEIKKLQNMLSEKPDFSNDKEKWAEKVKSLILNIVENGERKEKMVTTQGNKIGVHGKLFHSKSSWFEKEGIKVFPGLVKMVENGEAGFKTLRDFVINSLPDGHELRRELREIEEKEKKALEQWRKENADILRKIKELMEEW